ncbi:vWA domain-containing protein [Bartonella sp. HY406]|uniref:vWA domain-containing protein n=1 Tax=Bartonella sp. HY406 TaxID=2979331 RepID=UPI0021C99EF6|nr:vWA domain-containing protein [Bartonella sp. HY406]UXN02904.1 VWA domain-containing protein [Bartonella sp. HY406]
MNHAFRSLAPNYVQYLGRLVGLVLVSLLVAILSLTQVNAQNADREALKQEGRQTLYQRIVTKPGAILLPQSNSPDSAGKPLPAFEIYYVFARQNGVLEVAGNSRGATQGWIKQEFAVDWKHSIVAAFNNRVEVGRQRQLFFADKNKLVNVIGASDVKEKIAALRQNPGQQGSPVIALEPENIPSIDEKFYLLPILDFEKGWLHDDAEGTFLGVGSITQSEQSQQTPATAQNQGQQNPNSPNQPANDPNAQQAGNQQPKTGVMFVIDTTISMQPYIDATRDAVLTLKGDIEDSGKPINFGLIGFRQNETTNRGIGYHVKVFQRLTPTATADDFVTEISKMKTATRSTQGINEDALGGVFAGLEAGDWDAFDLKYMILITDAGPRKPEHGDNFAGSLFVDEINELARKKGIRITTLHVRTPEGARDHQYAEDAYRRLSRIAGGTLYTPITTTDVSGFIDQIRPAATQIVTDLNNIAAGRLTEAPAEDDNSAPAQIARASRAMQLEFLGRRENAAAPAFYEAWTIDRDFDQPAIKPALDIRIMLTKNQLSTLSETLRTIVNRSEVMSGDPMEFFRDIRDLAARASNDPRQLAADAPLGDAFGEYLEGLPYTSQILNLTPEDWVQMPASQQRDRILDLKSKLAFYERVHNDPNAWLQLQSDAAAGEFVTTISLDRLP